MNRIGPLAVALCCLVMVGCRTGSPYRFEGAVRFGAQITLQEQVLDVIGQGVQAELHTDDSGAPLYARFNGNTPSGGVLSPPPGAPDVDLPSSPAAQGDHAPAPALAPNWIPNIDWWTALRGSWPIQTTDSVVISPTSTTVVLMRDRQGTGAGQYVVTWVFLVGEPGKSTSIRVDQRGNPTPTLSTSSGKPTVRVVKAWCDPQGVCNMQEMPLFQVPASVRTTFRWALKTSGLTLN